MRRIFILTLFSTISSLLSAMQAPEAIQATDDQEAHNWATELYTGSFLGNVCNNLNQTPLHLAIGNMNLMKVLLKRKKRKIQETATRRDKSSAL